MSASISVLPPGPPPTTATPRHLLTVKEVGGRLGCSWRHVLRMADAGKMPTGLKLGALRRWDADVLEKWIAGGCQPVRNRA